MKINQLEADFNPRRVSDMERYENALEILEKPNEETKASAKMAFECKKAADFIDAIFGEGSSEKAIPDKENFDDCYNAVRAVIEETRKIQEETANKYAKYAPNRATRRAKK